MSTVPTPDGPVFTSSFMNGFFSKERRLAQMGSHHEADLQAREATHIVHYRNAIEKCVGRSRAAWPDAHAPPPCPAPPQQEVEGAPWPHHSAPRQRRAA